MRKRFFCIHRSQAGLSLVEVLVALGILAAVGATFMIGLAVTSKSSLVSQERVNAESLAKSQMERVKSWQYDADNNPPQYGDAKLLAEDIPDGYDLIISAERLDPKGDGTGNDDGIQKVTVAVTLNGETKFVLVGYKVTP
ncbi:MAG: hypothetical protein FJZ93_09945 [Chloroflexi bacterium]|nr:hypothetical protein [Chloroflexota bacterium]